VVLWEKLIITRRISAAFSICRCTIAAAVAVVNARYAFPDFSVI
jgi:hypothetical protein